MSDKFFELIEYFTKLRVDFEINRNGSRFSSINNPIDKKRRFEISLYNKLGNHFTIEKRKNFLTIAKSGRCRTVIPGHAAHSFRSMSHSDSGASRTH